MNFEGRGATELTILNPCLTLNELKNAQNSYATLRARASTIIISCGDQLQQGTQIKYNEMFESTIKACSNAPAKKTKVGLEATAIVNISSNKPALFALAANAKYYPRIVGTSWAAMTLGDNAGTSTGTANRPFKTVIFRPYEEGKPSEFVEDWIIFPWADVEGNADIAFNNTTDRGFVLNITAYDPFEKNAKIIIGDPSVIDL